MLGQVSHFPLSKSFLRNHHYIVAPITHIKENTLHHHVKPYMTLSAAVIKIRKLVVSFLPLEKLDYVRFMHIGTRQTNSTANLLAHARQTATALCAKARACEFDMQHPDLYHMTFGPL